MPDSRIFFQTKAVPTQEIPEEFKAAFTGMSEKVRLFQSIVNEAADGVYIINQENYDLLYANESKSLFMKGPDCIGKKCYEALHGKASPCEFCSLRSHKPNGKSHEMIVDNTDRVFSTRFRAVDWNGIPAYVKYIQDITEDVEIRKEKDRLEQYFQTLVKNLPGGVGVIRYEQNGHMKPEFLSDGFAEMVGMTFDEAWNIYREDAMAGVHPDDCEDVTKQVRSYIASGKSHCEIVYRLIKNNGYIWVKSTLSMIQQEGGEKRVYVIYHDLTKEREQQEQIRQQYEELIMQHYHAPDPNALIIGHCNVTQNIILEIIDHTDSDLLNTFGNVREEFFTGISELIVEKEERQRFLETYLNAPALAAFARKDTEHIQKCFIQLPHEKHGRYVQFKVTLVETPDSGDVTGVLTVTDITDQTISDHILHQLSVMNYDFVIDLDLERDTYTILTSNTSCHHVPFQGCHSEWTAHMLQTSIVPKDRNQYSKGLDPTIMRQRLKSEGTYTFSFSIMDNNGDVYTKNMTVSPVDLRLGRVCLVRTDITDSVREQQGLLNMIAYTFELAGFINIRSKSLTLYTRQTVLDNLSPYVMADYDIAAERFTRQYSGGESTEAYSRFQLATLLQQLAEKPGGYDFVFSYLTEGSVRYKQVNVLWGDENHKTICLVRADVTDMLSAERQAKKQLEDALALARDASRAKSDFLSAMSHDIRTPMNAIMGMTALASTHLEDQERVADCLQKISLSSRHLLSLINDILDMSKIEQSRLTLNHEKIFLPQLLQELSDMMAPQAKATGLEFHICTRNVSHEYFYGDSLRTNQIMINILGNAMKFTPAGGSVELLVKELPPDKNEENIHYCFTITDTGIGMPEEFCSQIFEPFTRSDTASQIEGTGLGLSITKGIIDLMDGMISVESQLDKGSKFIVDLEFEAAPPDECGEITSFPQDTSASDTKTLFSGRCFLIAEDNAINAEILSELLKMYGAESLVTANGAQVVEVFQNSEPGTFDTILMDIQMPEMNGYEATRKIREMDRPDAGVIPIIAMTANAFAEDVTAALDAGMNAHVAKPIDLDVLQAVISRALKI